MKSANFGQVQWKCRRGMLELDLLLSAFCNERYLHLTADQQQVFVCLLEEKDPVLALWLLGHDAPEDANLQEMVQLIIEHYRNRK